MRKCSNIHFENFVYKIYRSQRGPFKMISENWIVKEANVEIDVSTLSQHDTVRYDLLLWLTAQASQLISEDWCGCNVQIWSSYIQIQTWINKSL